MIRKACTIAPVILLAVVLSGCGEPGHHGTPSDPNEQQGNPSAKPEQSINQKPGAQADGDKAGKDPHTLTPANHDPTSPKR